MESKLVESRCNPLDSRTTMYSTDNLKTHMLSGEVATLIEENEKHISWTERTKGVMALVILAIAHDYKVKPFLICFTNPV